MKIYTMGFTKKSAEQFFSKISENKIELLLDVRLHNQSQLAGFTKGKDLAFFLRVICNCEYGHDVIFAPIQEILVGYKKRQLSWADYVVSYNELLEKRKVEEVFAKRYAGANRVLLLCSEPTAEHCHRRLLAEWLKGKLPDIEVIHL